jgi:hypothetical protein
MRIDPKQHDWMTAPETAAVMAALVEARFVGGPRRAGWPFHAAERACRWCRSPARDKIKKTAPP